MNYIEETIGLNKKNSSKIFKTVFIMLGIVLVFIYLGFKNYLLFHILIELFCVFTSFTMCFIVVSTHNIYQSNYFKFLSISYGFVGLFDLLHAFAYKGMGVFPNDTANLATQLWIIGRYIQSISLLISFKFIHKKANIKNLFIIYSIVFLVLILSVFQWGIFPDCFIDGSGLTAFKKTSEYIISIILLTAVIKFYTNIKKYNKQVFHFIIASILTLIFSELFFTLYTQVNDILNMMGHILKLISFYILYNVVNEFGLKTPYKSAFYELIRINSEFKLKSADLQFSNEELRLEDINREFIEKSFKESIETYKNLLEFLPDAAFIQFEGNIEFINTSYKEMLGIEKEEEILGKKVIDTIHDEYKEVVINRINQLNHLKKLSLCEIKLIRKDGREIYVETTATKIQYKKRDAALVILRDITDRKKIEKMLIDSEKNYKNLFNTLPEAIFIYNNGKIVLANDEAVNLVGVESIEQIIGQPACSTMYMEKSRRDSVIEYMTSFNKEGNSRSWPNGKLIQKNGKTIDVDISSIPFHYNGELSILTVVRDTTERKKAEKNQKLLKEAIRYDRLKTEFFSNMSHELKTPLNVILGTIQLLELYIEKGIIGNNEKEINRYINIMKQNCYRLLRLINNIIDITKMDSGFYQIKLENHNIISIIEDIALSIAEYTKNKGIDIIFDTEVEEKIIAVDPDKMERVMLNLLSNAIKFTDIGGIISVNIYDKENSIIISVKDTGVGIPEDKLKNIFERFSQVEKTIIRNKEGSGIGLSLVKSLVELHGGNISVNSEFGKGSEFIIELPVKVLKERPYTENNIGTNSGNIERISIEFSDIYSLN